MVMTSGIYSLSEFPAGNVDRGLGTAPVTTTMAGKDEYYNRAKQEGYRARSAYKLRQLDDSANLLDSGDTVLDLGGAPGGWLQVVAERIGPEGRALGVDRQRIDELEASCVETMRADVTDEDTPDRIRNRLDAGTRPVDVVLSDLAPNMSGEYELDHARSVHLARTAFELAEGLLGAGGDLAVKVFDGRDLEDLHETIEREFEYVRQVRPDASRDSSSELYLVAKNRLTAPVRAGDTRELEVVDTGSEGDGIARIDGFTIFVPEAEVGEHVDVEVTDVKPQYAFTRRLE